MCSSLLKRDHAGLAIGCVLIFPWLRGLARDLRLIHGTTLEVARGDVKAETELLKTVHFRATATSEEEKEKVEGRLRGSKLMFEQDVVCASSSSAALSRRTKVPI